MTHLSTSLVEAINMYHLLMQDGMSPYICRQNFSAYYVPQSNAAEYVGKPMGLSQQYQTTNVHENFQQAHHQRQQIPQQYPIPPILNTPHQYFNENPTSAIHSPYGLQTFVHNAPYVTTPNTVMTQHVQVQDNGIVIPTTTTVNQPVPSAILPQQTIPTYHQQR